MRATELRDLLTTLISDYGNLEIVVDAESVLEDVEVVILLDEPYLPVPLFVVYLKNRR